MFVTLCIILFLAGINFERKIFFAAMWLLVMALELINSAVERAFDLVDKSFRPEIKAGKDMLSAATFIFVGMNIILWLAEIINALST